MHDPSADDDPFGNAFGRNMRVARSQKSWSQRELAEALNAKGVKLDPSAVTRIERGDREVKLREAVAIADCLDTDLEHLLMPVGPDDELATVLELRRLAEERIRLSLDGFAGVAQHARGMKGLLELSRDAEDGFRRLRDRSETLAPHELVVADFEDLLRDLRKTDTVLKLKSVDERMRADILRLLTKALEDVFIGEKKPRGAVRCKQHSANQGDAEA